MDTRNFTFYRIEPFYENKRKQLVSNIVRIIVNDEVDTQNRYIAILCDALTKQKYLYSCNGKVYEYIHIVKMCQIIKT